MLDLFWDNRCNADGYNDFDLMYVSELDPTWNNDEMAFFTNPEVALFANPVAISSCVADGAAATAGHPIDAMFWCAGTWGSMYPFTGLANPTVGADPRLTSLFAIRATATLHRRGLAFGTVGNDALCGGNVAPFIPKSQYSMTMFYPLADTDRRHAIGESTFRWGMAHSVGRIYQQTFVDTYSKVAMAKLYTTKTPITAADLLNDRVLPFFAEHGMGVLRILTDRGTEYCGKAETHDYQLYLAFNDVEHTKTRARHPQTNGICERFHKTLLQEFYQVAFRKKFYLSVDELQADMDIWIDHYNQERTHQGKMCCGRTPLQTLVDGEAVWNQKVS